MLRQWQRSLIALVVAAGSAVQAQQLQFAFSLMAPDDGTQASDLIFSGDGRYLAMGASSGVLIWDLQTRKVLTSPDNRGVGAMALHPNGRQLVYANGAGASWVDLPSGKLQSAWEGIGRNATSMDFTRDGKRLAIAQEDAVRVYDLASAKEISSIKSEDAKGKMSGMVISKDGKTIITGDEQESGLALFDLESGKLLTTLKSDVKGLISIKRGRDSDLMVTNHSNYKAVVWDLKQNAVKGVIPTKEKGGYSSGTKIAVSPDGRFIAAAAGDDGASVWSTDDSKLVGRATAVHPRAAARSVAFSADGKRLAVGYGWSPAKNHPTIMLWTLTGSKDGAPPASFISQAGRFEISFPADPKETQRKSADMDEHQFAYEVGGSRAFSATYLDVLGADFTGKDPQQVIEKFRKGYRKGKTFLKDKQITVDGYPGREHWVDATDALTVRERIFLAGNRLYIIWTGDVRDKAFLESKDAERFLTSFHIIKP
jgi:hypothetical protein